MLIRHVENHNLQHKKDVDEILHVEVFHGSKRALAYVQVCAGYLYCLLAVGEGVSCFSQKLVCGSCWTCSPRLCY